MFERNSAWGQEEDLQRKFREEERAAFQVPVRTPEENQRIADEQRDRTGKYQRIHEDTLAEWADRLDILGDEIDASFSSGLGTLDLRELAGEIRSHLRG